MKGPKFEQTHGLTLIEYDRRKFLRDVTVLENGQTVVTFTRRVRSNPVYFYTGQVIDLATTLFNTGITNRLGDVFNHIVPTPIGARHYIYEQLSASTIPSTDMNLGVLQLPDQSTTLSVNMRFNALRPYDPANRSERGFMHAIAHMRRAFQAVTAFDTTVLQPDPFYPDVDPSVQIVLWTEVGRYASPDTNAALSLKVNDLTNVLTNSQLFDIIR